jgi:hypothetical protein
MITLLESGLYETKCDKCGKEYAGPKHSSDSIFGNVNLMSDLRQSGWKQSLAFPEHHWLCPECKDKPDG